ncbi:MAG TPA: hypothetical protein VMR41_04245 [Patescibacteria group bacterium]|nr:hypothetical protein [Patescibacteria group bacterium]
MKYIITHTSPDWDAIGSVWLIKRYLSGWQEAKVLFVPAGQRVQNSKYKIQIEDELKQVTDEAIEKIGEDEYMHVDTGLGPLDHHQTNDQTVCGASRCWEYIQVQSSKLKVKSESNVFLSFQGKLESSEGSVLAGSRIKSGMTTNEASGFTQEHKEAISRIVKILVEIDHFREIFWGDPLADYQEFSLVGILDGLKLAKPSQDDLYMDYGITSLNALVDEFENRIWAEKEIKEKGVEFESRWGKSIGFETLNDTVIKLSQKMGYNLVLRKDPNKGYVRIKLRPTLEPDPKQDLTLAYENLHKIDPDATWYLHIGKKMLLNGTPKNPKMIATKLSLQQIIEVLKKI